MKQQVSLLRAARVFLFYSCSGPRTTAFVHFQVRLLVQLFVSDVWCHAQAGYTRVTNSREVKC